MARRPVRLNVTLAEPYAAKRRRLAERTHVQEGTIARSFLSRALDEVDPDPRHVVEVLDGRRSPAGGRDCDSWSARGSWLLLVYVHLEDEDRVVVVTIQDGRSSSSATAQ